MSNLGPTGIQGVQGIQGVTGPQGIQGATGIQGPAGLQGPAGSQGLRGPDGPQGSIGPTGPQGSIGPTGAQGLRGVQGDQGVAGPQGPPSGLTGPTGSSSLWVTNGVNMYFTPTGNTGGVGINKTNPAYTLDVSGSLNVSGAANFNTNTSVSVTSTNLTSTNLTSTNVTSTNLTTTTLTTNNTSYLCNISEKMITITAASTNTFNLDFSQSSVFYLSTAPTGNITFNLYNVPSVTDASHSFVFSVIYKGVSANYYGTTVNVTSTNTPGSGTSYTPKFTSTPSVASITSSQLIVQQITYVFLGTTGYVISNVNGFGA